MKHECSGLWSTTEIARTSPAGVKIGLYFKPFWKAVSIDDEEVTSINFSWITLNIAKNQCFSQINTCTHPHLVETVSLDGYANLSASISCRSVTLLVVDAELTVMKSALENHLRSRLPRRGHPSHRCGLNIHAVGETIVNSFFFSSRRRMGNICNGN